MKAELVDPILDGYAAIIRELLDSDDGLRFERITRFAKMAHALQQQLAMRVGDINAGRQGHCGAVQMDDIVQMGGNVMPHQMDMIREVVGAFHPIVNMYMEREQETRLNKLFDIQERMREARQPTDVIDQRIKRLIDNMKKESDDADPSMVHPDLLRGHPVETDGPGELQGNHGEPDGSGNGGVTEAPQGGDEEGLVDGDQEPKLEGHDDNRRADRQGCGRHREGIEAGS